MKDKNFCKHPNLQVPPAGYCKDCGVYVIFDDDDDIPSTHGSDNDALQGYGTVENWEKHKGRGFWGNSSTGYIEDKDA